MLTCHKYTKVILIHSPIRTYHKHQLSSSFVTRKHFRLCFRIFCLILFVRDPNSNSVFEAVVYMSPFFNHRHTQIKNLHRNAVVGMLSLINAHLLPKRSFACIHLLMSISRQPFRIRRTSGRRKSGVVKKVSLRDRRHFCLAAG